MMPKRQAVNTVALHMEAIISEIDRHVGELIQGAPRNVIVLINAGDMTQYAGNVEREHGKALLIDVLTRWQADLPDVLPDDPTGPSAGFRVLLENLERGPAEERDNARHNLLRYVADLESRTRR